MKLITPEDREAKASRPSHSLAEVLREKHLAPYVLLSCGDYTTRDEIEFYSLWQPKRGRYYCSRHGSWKNQQKPKPHPIPDEPMF